MIKLALGQLQYLVIIAKYESIIKVMNKRILNAISKTPDGKTIHADLSKNPIYLKNQKEGVSKGEGNYFATQTRISEIELNGKIYRITLM